MLCGINDRFQSVSPSERQIAHVLLTRPPLSLRSITRRIFPINSVRLACVRRAASVRPEPGSNSLFKLYIQMLTHLYIDPSNHDFARNYLCDFFVFSDFLKFQSLGISRAFSLVVHCSIFKILSKQLSCCNFYIISHSEVFVK